MNLLTSWSPGQSAYLPTYTASTSPVAPAPAAPSVSAAQLNSELARLQAQLQSIESQINSILAAMSAPAVPAAPPAPSVQPVSLLGSIHYLFNQAWDTLSDWFSTPGPAPTQPGTPSQPPPPPMQPTQRTEFVISSFNVLGSSHTIPGRSERPGMDTGVVRIRRAAELLRQHKVDIVGFQEFQPDQVKEFNRVAGNTYDVYPGMKLGRGPNVNSIAWDKSKWDLVKPSTIKIPYFNGHEVKMPVVLLRNKQTGQKMYVANFHNPASTKKHPGNERWRDEAARRQVDLVNRLMKESGLPVFVTGDMNERDEYYHTMTKGAPMISADRPNGKGPKHMGIDWIFGSKGVTFTDYVRDRGPLVQKTTDHPMIVSKARIG